MFHEYPYQNFQDFNLDWILKIIKELEKNLENFINLNTIKYADPINWNITRQYEANTVVIDPYDGTAYLSVKEVPNGVIITNTDYWTPIFNYGDVIENIKSNIASNELNNTTASRVYTSGELVWFNNALYITTTALPVGTAFVINGNIEAITVENFVRLLIENLKTYTDDEINNLKNYTDDAISLINDPINVLTLGVKNDGTEPDGTTNSAIINANIGKSLYFPKGIYSIASPIICELEVQLYLDREAELIASTSMDYMIYHCPYTDYNDDAWNSIITGGIFNGNNLVDTLIACNDWRNCIIENCSLKNFLVTAINTGYTSPVRCASNILQNLYIYNETYHYGAIGIDNVGADNFLINITTIDCTIGVKSNSGNKFYNVHSWVHPENFQGTIAFILTGQNFLTDCTSDTMQIGVKLTGATSVTFIENFRYALSTATGITQTIINDAGGYKVFNIDATVERLIVNNIYVQTDFSTGGEFINDTVYQKNAFFLHNKITNLSLTSYGESLKNVQTGLLNDSKGVLLPSNIDLNTYLYGGVFWSASGAQSATVSNLPESSYQSSGFRLEVIPVGNYVKQIITSSMRNTSKISHYRVGDGTSAGWGAWFRTNPDDYHDVSAHAINRDACVDSIKFTRHDKIYELCIKFKPTATGLITLCTLDSGYYDTTYQKGFNFAPTVQADANSITFAKMGGSNVFVKVDTVPNDYLYINIMYMLP